MHPLALAFLGIAAAAGAAFAGWPSDPSVNLLVCGSRYAQRTPRMVSDGAGGALVVWLDLRRSPNDEVYGARIQLDGGTPWPYFGRALADSSLAEGPPVIDTDGAGGAVIAWRFHGTSTAFAQRVDGDGSRLWGPRGILVASDLGSTEPRIASDGASGAIVVWSTCMYCSGGVLRAQRVGSEGAFVWPSGGVTVCAGTCAQDDFDVTADGSGGIFMVWLDSRGGLYAQHLDSTGAASWAANGIPLGAGKEPHLTADGSGGVLVSYIKNISIDLVYAQHLTSAGQRLWGANGVLVYAGAGYTGGGWSRLVPDGAGGAIIGFDNSGESYTVNPSHVFAQRIGVAGQLLWGSSGSPLPICQAPNVQRSTQVVADGQGGAYFVWMDGRAAPGFGPYDIYAQRVDSGGQVQWATNGVAVCNAPGDQASPVVCLSGVGGLLVAWEDERGASMDVYAQHVDPNGSLGLVVSDVRGFDPRAPLQLQVANPVRRRAHVQFRLAAPAAVLVRVHDVAGRLCQERDLGILAAGEQKVGIEVAGLPRGTYILTVRAAGESAARKITCLEK